MSDSHGSGGDLSLDFHNTATWIGDEAVSDETLIGYEDLLHWCGEAGLLPTGASDAFHEAARNEEAARRAVGRAHQLRRTIHGLFASIAAGGSPGADQITEFNEFLTELPLRLERAGDREYAWQWWFGELDLSDILRPIIWSATSLLRSPEITFVKTCGNDRCGWLFVDRSRRRNRRWCDMRDCGNRAKVRRYYERHRRRSKG